MKKLLFMSLALMGLEAFFFVGYAGRPKENPLMQYVEKDDNVVLYNDVERITFSKNGEGVSALHNVQKTFKNLRKKEKINDVLYYNDEFSPLEVYMEEGASIQYSSSLADNGIFFDGMNNCFIEMNFADDDWTCAYRYNQKYPNAIFLPNYFFSEDLFVVQKVLTIEVPSWLDMEIKEFAFDGSIEKRVEQKGKSTIYTYTMKNVKKRKKESFSPSVASSAPNLLFLYKSVNSSKGSVTLFKTAQDQYDWYRNLLSQNKEDISAVGVFTKQITAKCKTPQEKVSVIYEWVQQNIRYIAIENSINGFKPHPALTVLENKYGDCKGMANLLKYMLKSEGIDGRLVWLSNDGRPYDYSMPSLAVDNHAICAAILGKDTIYLDGTCEYAAFGSIPCSIEGRPVMIENGEKCILTHIPSNKPCDNLDSSFISLRIEDNQLKGSFKNVRRGEDKEHLFSAMDGDFSDVKAMLRSLKYPGLPASESDIVISESKVSDKQVSVSYPISSANHCHPAGNEYYVSMEYGQPFGGGVIDLKDRRNDLNLSYKTTDVLTTELTVPTGYKISYLPANLTIDKPAYRFEIKYMKKGNKVIYNRRLIIKETIIPLAQIASWNKDVEALKAAYAEMLVIKK